MLGDAAVQLGALGPIVFFAISGFLLYRPWVAARAAGAPAPAAGRYARRRALRILPAYWVALTVLAVFPGITGVFTGDWWRYYLFLQAYDARTLGLGIPVRGRCASRWRSTSRSRSGRCSCGGCRRAPARGGGCGPRCSRSGC